MDRTTFMDGLRAFHESQGRAFRPQKVSGHTLDPYRMFLMIVARGGYSRVNKNSRWFVFGKPMGIDIPEGKQQEVGFGIKNYYLNWLREYEKALDDSTKLAMAAEFAANNPDLVPNPGLALSYYSQVSTTNTNEEAPLTRSAAASLSRTRGERTSEQMEKTQAVSNPLQVIDSADSFYLIPCESHCIHNKPKPPSNLTIYDLDEPYVPKYPITDDLWYLMAHFRNPDSKMEDKIQIINNLMAIAANKRLNLSSFPSILNEFSEIMTISTFFIDSLILRSKKLQSESPLDINRLKTMIERRVCLLDIVLIQKHLLSSSSSLVSLILSDKENLEFIYEVSSCSNIGKNFLRISTYLDNKPENDQEAINQGVNSSKTSDYFNSSGPESLSHSNTLKSCYLRVPEAIKSFEQINNFYAENSIQNRELNIVHLRALLTALLTVFRTSSGIIFLYERKFHSEVLPLVLGSSNCFQKINPCTEKVIIKLNASPQVEPETDNKENIYDYFSLYKEGDTNSMNEISFKAELNREAKSRKPNEPDLLDQVLEYLNSETRYAWTTLSSTMNSLNQLIPVVFDDRFDEVLSLMSSFIMEIFRSCKTCCQFSIPSLANCTIEVRKNSCLLPCLIYNKEGIQLLSDTLEFGCNVILNITSGPAQSKVKCNQKLLNSFFQTILKLSSTCIGFYSFLKDEENFKSGIFCSNIKSIKDLYEELVLPISLATLTTISEHVSFGRIFQSFSNLNYHYLHHHTQFTQSLIESQPNSQAINQEILNMSDSNDSFVKDQILILWGRETIGPVFELLKSELDAFAKSKVEKIPVSCLMLSQYIIYISSELMSWKNSQKDPNLQKLHCKSSREIAIGILSPFIDVLIELAWIPSTFRNLFWSIISEISNFGVSNPSVTLGISKFSVRSHSRD
ncbi:protein with BRIGHT domain like HTH domain at N-terminus [Cryptosporidium sp. chipmunk genotype I]|uniref:protein with BRIGHT domain like HTH domain at N-terminus n=1 Tax=Cryptosporidium sp. chipmunk genotype I TaxID=1280935 RepID=UPI00351A385C|nr:protein with BRIGHT domain like HTH domain at N-terminus [Cryptosporidium sp. chipmunk genotype I]